MLLPMTTTTTSSVRDRLVQAAHDLMLVKGYPSTSVDEICKRAGVTKGSFYHFFRTKEEIGLAALEHFANSGRALLMTGAYTTIEDPIERAFGFLDRVESQAEEIWGHGCLVGTLATEMSNTNPVIQTEVRRIFDELLDRFGRIFAPISERAGAGAPAGEELGELFLAVLQGAVVIGRAHGDAQRIPRAVRQFRRYLEELIR